MHSGRSTQVKFCLLSNLRWRDLCDLCPRHGGRWRSLEVTLHSKRSTQVKFCPLSNRRWRDLCDLCPPRRPRHGGRWRSRRTLGGRPRSNLTVLTYTNTSIQAFFGTSLSIAILKILYILTVFSNNVHAVHNYVKNHHMFAYI